jgi:hypothetical protein
VAILNPDHLFDQADALATGGVGRPRQVDIRRAISASYYGLFHAAVTAAADLAIGQNNRAELRYGLAYRSIEHNRLRELCTDLQKQSLPDKYKRYVSLGVFGAGIKAFAIAVLESQEKRHIADYDPTARVKQSDAILLIRTARAALQRFQNADADERTLFLTLLLFPPRK